MASHLVRLRVARKVVKRCRQVRKQLGLSNDYSRRADSLGPYREPTVAVALHRIAKHSRRHKPADVMIYLSGLLNRTVH